MDFPGGSLDQHLEPPEVPEVDEDNVNEDGELDDGSSCDMPSGCRFRGCPTCDPPDPYEENR